MWTIAVVAMGIVMAGGIALYLWGNLPSTAVIHGDEVADSTARTGFLLLLAAAVFGVLLPLAFTYMASMLGA